MDVADTVENADSKVSGHPRGRWIHLWIVRVLLAIAVLAMVGAVIAWLSRERIATNVIDDALESYGLAAEYDLISIDPQRQVIENLVLGDPDAPDLTVERLVVHIDYGWLSAGIGRLEVQGARVFASYKDGQLSLGSLDEVLFSESQEPFEPPAFPLIISDARARIDSDFGVIGAKFDGEGSFAGTLTGKLAATAPGIGVERCRAETAMLYGDLVLDRLAPRFEGPVRLREAACEGARLANLDVDAQFALDDSFETADGDFSFAATGFSGFAITSRVIGGEAKLSWSADGVRFGHDVTARAIATDYGNIAELRADGIFRTAGKPLESQWDVRVDGSGASFPLDRVSAIDKAIASVADTMVEPLLVKVKRGLTRSATGASIGADATVRMAGDSVSIIVPDAQIRAAGGETLLSVSRLSWQSGGQLSGNVLTGGADLPRIAGRMEQSRSGARVFRLTMEEYSAGQSSLAIPQIEVSQGSNGAVAFTGRVAASGPIPGGSIEGLKAPVEGTWSAANGLALGQRCTAISFGRATYYDLTLFGRELSLCSEPGRPLLAYRDSLRIGASTRNLAIKGELGGGPIVLTADRANLAFPGRFTADNVFADIGPTGNGVELFAKALWGSLDDQIGGEFSEGTVAIDDVPLNFDQVSGKWRLDGYRLQIDQGAFRTTEKVEEGVLERFNPLFAQGATVSLEGTDLVVQADLREPDNDRLITSLRVDHDVWTSEGRAVLDIPGITFDSSFQPNKLTYLTEGVIADAVGTVFGEGLIEWDSETLQSQGRFTTEAMNLSAAFGPVERISGTIVFDDLLNLTSAPKQVLKVGSINPGVEVFDGNVEYSITDGQTLVVSKGEWPFFEGTLKMQPVTILFAEQQAQLYVFELIGVHADAFVAQMELTNIGASGIFDGTVPVAFDQAGNGKVAGGLLISRPPGGNLSYVGDLTYEDLGAVGNFAFQSLRSLDYTQMMVGLNGSLGGEIITDLRFDGVSQGEGARRNFITRRLARLPIRFNVKVTSQNFYELSTVVRSYFDPSYLSDPVNRGIFDLDADGKLVPRDPNPLPPGQETPEPDNDAIRSDESPVQPPESDDMQ